MKHLKGSRGTMTARQRGFKAFVLELLQLLLLPLVLVAERWYVLYANHKGSEGTVKIGSNVIAEIRGWSLSQSANTIDDTELGDTAETHQPGTTSWSGSVTCFWDETDTNGQEAMTIGTSVTLNLYPEGATSGDKYYTGTATITGIERSGAINGMVEAVYSFKGSGALTPSTVAP
jgi:hypothetical protein